MDKIWYRNPSESEVIGRCGGGGKNQKPPRTHKKRKPKKKKKKKKKKSPWRLYGEDTEHMYIKHLSVQSIFRQTTQYFHIPFLAVFMK